jgi:hypothetical protein
MKGKLPMNTRKTDRMVYGLFDRPEELELAFNRLLVVGLSLDDISLLMNEDVHERDFERFERTHTRDGIAAGSVIGGALGGILGGLAVLGSAMTGIGILVVGPALALAATGGLLGGLIGHGIPEDEAKRIQEALHAGKTMIAVHARSQNDAHTARAILRNTHAEAVEVSA